ncbi:MAG TPA: hypothetical protein VGK30_07570 [Candidatus Binatia bacterium]
MRRITVAGLVVVVGVLAFGAVTWVALEGQEVVVVRTHGDDGAAHATRTWVADAGGATWIEAANPERPFLRDLERTPELELERGGGLRRCRAEIVPNPEGHRHIRELLAGRYGWADCWIGLIADTRRSVEVRLSCG